MLGEKTRRAVKTPLINLGKKPRRAERTRPITLLFCIVCLIGLSVSATYLIDHAKFKKLSGKEDEEILALQKNNKSLSDKNIALENSLQKLENEHTNLESQYKDLASGLDTAEQKNTQTASELTSALKDLEVARGDTLRLRDELDSKLSEIEALKVDQQTLVQKYNGFKEMMAPYLILEPTLVGSDETTMAFHGNLGIVLYEASDTSMCHKQEFRHWKGERGRKWRNCVVLGLLFL